MIKNHIRQYLQHFRISDELQKVAIQPLPESITHHDLPVIKGQSHRTAANFILNLELCGHYDLKYVLGFRSHSIPLEYALIRKGDSYYDPAGSTTALDKSFVPLWELTADQLSEFIHVNDAIPSLYDGARL